MKRSETPTKYIIVKTAVNGEFNACDFAIVHITADWKETMRQRTELAAQRRSRFFADNFSQ